MDARLVYAVQRHAGLTACETAVLVALATCRNRTTGDCFPSVSTVAALAHVTPRSVKRCIRSLRDIGLLAVERFATGCGRRSRYTFADALFENQIDLGGCPLEVPDELSTDGDEVSPSGDTLSPSTVTGCHGEGTERPLKGDRVSPIKKNEFINSVCESMDTHTQVADADLSGLDALGVPRSFTRRMIADLVASGWRTTKGEAVTSATLAAHIVKWWRCERNQGAYLANGGEGADAPQRAARAYTASDWILCRERCAEYRDGGCAAGVAVPPEHSPAPFPPEECRHFSNIEQGKAVTA